MRILVVDDHPMVMQGIAASLTRKGHEVSTARDIAGAREALKNADSLDLLLLDYNLPPGTGADLLADPQVKVPPCVAILSGMTEPEDILAAFELGARAFIPKSIEPEHLIRALEELPGLSAEDELGWLWDTRQGRYVRASEAFPRGTVLSPKERKVFMLLRMGRLDKQIAEELKLSIHTVRVHIRGIRRKRSSRRRAEREI